MSLTDAIAHLDVAAGAIQAAKRAMVPGPPATSVTIVTAGQSLQAALDGPLPVEIEAGARFEGSYRIRTGQRAIFGAGAAVHGETGPALRVDPGTRNVAVTGGRMTSGAGDVIAIGENSSQQTRVEDAPDGITLTGVVVPEHRSKRAFGIHAANVLLDRCEGLNVWSTAGQDSQAIYIGNAPGPITIRGGRYSAGSEVVLVGGDGTRIPGLNPTGITIEDTQLFRPLSWKTDGIKRKVKNLLELKAGIDVTVRRSRLQGNWKDGQVGFAILLTPALDGSATVPPSDSGIVENVLIEDCDVLDVAGGFMMFGRHYSCVTRRPLSGVVVRRNRFRISRAAFGGFGQFLQVAGEPGDLSFQDNTILADGSSFVYAYQGPVLDPDTGLKRPAGQIGSFGWERNLVSGLGSYGFNMLGLANASVAAFAAAANPGETGGNRYNGSARGGWVGTTGTFVLGAAFDVLPEIVALRLA